jgi:hypothetical protein
VGPLQGTVPQRQILAKAQHIDGKYITTYQGGAGRLFQITQSGSLNIRFVHKIRIDSEFSTMFISYPKGQTLAALEADQCVKCSEQRQGN